VTNKPWLEHYDAGVPATLEPYPDRTLLDYLAASARSNPKQPITIMHGAALGYRDLERQSNAVAAALADIGVRPGDRVALCLPNVPQFLVAEFGAWKAGAVVCPINPMYTEHELVEALRVTGAETVVTLNRFYGKLKPVQHRTAVKRIITSSVKEYLPAAAAIAYTLLREKKAGDRITLERGDLRLRDLVTRYRRAAPPSVRVRPDDRAVILMSGGTSGTPKGVVGLHRALVIAGCQLRAWLRPTMREWSDRIMLPLPLFHTYGNTGAQGLAFVNHNPIVLIPDPRDIGEVLSEIERTRPAFICAVPTLLTALMHHSRTRAGKVPFDSIKLCFSGAAPLMAETKRRWEELTGGVLIEGYSLTEAQMAVVANPVLGAKKLGSVGMPLPDVAVSILDPDDGERSMPQGETGEIVLSAPQLMQCYWQRDDETRAMLRTSAAGERLLFTGDLGYLDEDGYLFIVDRKKDLIKPSGYQVWPREVEEVISSHPAVAECGVAGLPDAARGEIIKAWVVLRPGAAASVDQLKTHCREHLAPYKVPSRWEFVSDLPKTTVGKVLRRELRRRELESKASSARESGRESQPSHRE
jgi:long-chain acyl-CoA synthetase